MDFLDDNDKMIDFFRLTKEEFLSSYSYLKEEDYNATKRKIEESNKTLKINDNEYKIKIEKYDNTKLLKVSLVDKKNNEKKEITMEGVELVIPTAPTPDCVLVNNEKDKDIIDVLLKEKILDYNNVIFAKFNMKELYKYDKIGTMRYLHTHSHIVEYDKEKANTIDYIKANIREDAQKILDNQEMQDYLWDNYLISDTKTISEIYTLINNKQPETSNIIMYDTNTEKFLMITPYIKENKLKVLPIEEWEFDYDNWLFQWLENEHQLFVPKDYVIHYNIWNYIEEMYPEEIEFKEGMKKYLQYCKENGINKKKIEKELNTDVPNIMKYYKDKKRMIDDR